MRIKTLQTLERAATRLLAGNLASALRGPVRRYIEGRSTAEVRVQSAGLFLSGSLRHRSYLYALDGSPRAEATSWRYFRDSVFRGANVIDVGAYLGFYGLTAGRLIGSGGRVLMFEPDPRTFPYLRTNLLNNGMGPPTVLAFEAAVGAAAARVGLSFTDGDPSQTRIRPGLSPGSPAEVQVHTLDSICAQHGVDQIDVLKVDAEGSEITVLSGAENVLGASADVTLVIECNPPALEEAGGSPAEMLRLLKRYGFECSYIDEQAGTIRPIAELPDRSDVNLLCRKTPH